MATKIASDEELNPKGMTAGIIKTMKYGGCSPRYTSLGYRFLALIFILYNILMVILLVLKLYFTPSKSIINMLEDATMLFGFIQITSKYVTSVRSAQLLSDMLDSLYNDFWSLNVLNDKDKKEALARYRIANNLSLTYSYVVVMAVFSFCIQAGLKGNKSLVVDIWIPHKEILKVSPYYELVYAWEFFFFPSSVYFAVIPMDRLFILLTCYVCEQMKMIRKKLTDIGGHLTNEENYNIVRECIIHHNIVLNFIDNFNAVYSRLFLPTIGTNFILITLNMYGLTVEERVTRQMTNLLIYLAVTGQLFAYCLAGQLIQDEGLRVGEAAYECKWYDVHPGEGSKKIKLDLAMMIIRAQRKIEITVGGIIILSLETFASIVRSTFSFMTFIVNMRSQ